MGPHSRQSETTAYSSHPQGLNTNMGGGTENQRMLYSRQQGPSGLWLDMEPHWDAEVRKAEEKALWGQSKNPHSLTCANAASNAWDKQLYSLNFFFSLFKISF